MDGVPQKYVVAYDVSAGVVEAYASDSAGGIVIDLDFHMPVIHHEWERSNTTGTSTSPYRLKNENGDLGKAVVHSGAGVVQMVQSPRGSGGRSDPRSRG